MKKSYKNLFSLKKIKDQFKKIGKILLKTYLITYVGLLSHAISDYHLNHQHNRKEKPSELSIKKYTANLNGKEKRLTLVGEIHLYNYAEHNIGKNLVLKYDNFAYEGDGNLPFSDKLFRITTSCLLYSGLKFYGWGSGRSYSNINGILRKSGKKITRLEKNVFEHFSFSNKITLLGLSLMSLACAPYSYYIGKYIKQPTPNKRVSNLFFEYFEEPLIDTRDKVMGTSLIEILKRDEVDNLLGVFGKAHFEGIENYLLEHVELNEINEK